MQQRNGVFCVVRAEMLQARVKPRAKSVCGEKNYLEQESAGEELSFRQVLRPETDE
jgi:hypothetical protein